MTNRLRAYAASLTLEAPRVNPKKLEPIETRRERAPLPKPPQYPGCEKPEVSAKLCKNCGKKQIRQTQLFGPGPESLWEKLPIKKPRITSEHYWRRLHLAWLVSPPDPPAPNQWYRVRVKGICPQCGEEHHEEKDYRRQFGRFGKLSNHFWAIYSALKGLIPPVFGPHSSFQIIRIQKWWMS